MGSAGVQRQVIVLLAAAALAMIGLAVAGLGFVIGFRGGPETIAIVTGGLLFLGLLLLWQAWAVSREHFIALERLKGAIVSLAGNTSARLPDLRQDDDKPEIRSLHAALAALDARHAQDRAAPDDRLQAVLATIPEALLVITDDGQVSLVNHAAKALLGAERVAVGSSVYAALSRTSVRSAVALADRAGSPVDAMIGTLEEHQLTTKVARLPGHGGTVITIPVEEVEFRAELDADLALLDLPPPIERFDDNTPLVQVPFLVMDTETTGLDVAHDRVISIGALRLCGGRMYRATSFDRLVNPGIAIPPRSTAIHGITDPMVTDAPPFADVYPALDRLMAETVVVGHQVAFDLAILRQECARHDCRWVKPRALDTLLLVTCLLPRLNSASLDTVAAELGVSIHGRHTALGDSLVTAEIFANLLPRLADQGVTTLGPGHRVLPPRQTDHPRARESRMVAPFERRPAERNGRADREGIPAIVRQASRTAFYFGLLLVIALSVIPQDAVPQTGLWDKTNHILAYAALAATGSVGYRGLRVWVLIAVGLLILGAALELAQSVLPGRFASVQDVVANAIGIALGSLLAVGADALWTRHSPSGQ